jgi:hypothetical protein
MVFHLRMSAATLSLGIVFVAALVFWVWIAKN